ncbi:MAG: dihydrolipoamide acetyltransferase family protein [Acidimicrobiales bacterium]
MADVTMPQLGETVTEGTITQWFKNVGDSVAMDEILFEVSTDKVDSEVPSPVAGVLTEILAAEGDVVEVGQILCRVGDADEPVAPEPDVGSEPRAMDSPEPAAAMPSPEPVATQPTPPSPPESTSPVSEPDVVHEVNTDGVILSPVVRRLISDNALDVSQIVGTGLGGRITRADVEAVIQAKPSAVPAVPPTPADESVGAPPVTAPPVDESVVAPPVTVPPVDEPVVAPSAAAPPVVTTPPEPARAAGDQIVPLNNVRKRTAEHMVMSKATSPHVLTAIEVDYERVEQVRKQRSAAWKAEEGFSLTYLPFITRAVADALRDFPHLNASFAGDHLIVHDTINMAVAVDIDFEGLLAPVVKQVDGKRLRQIAREIKDVADRTRTKQLTPDDLSGGTFTLTNAGQYGTMMQFPIINQPQVAILSTDGVKRKPVVVTDEFGNESIAIHSVGVLALAWDHRAFDGAYAAAFLDRIRTIIESRDWEAEIN